jgi:hypothetical protein
MTATAGAYIAERAGSAPGPASLIPNRLAIEGRVWEPIDDARTTDGQRCPFGKSAHRAWSEDARASSDREVFVTVCAYDLELEAWSVYKSQSLYEVGGNDWPNFESWSDAPTAPGTRPLVGPEAEQWEIGCGLGDPDRVCQIWVFRARYGATLTVLELQSYLGAPVKGSRFATMHDLVRAVDAHLEARLRDA